MRRGCWKPAADAHLTSLPGHAWMTTLAALNVFRRPQVVKEAIMDQIGASTTWRRIEGGAVDGFVKRLIAATGKS